MTQEELKLKRERIAKILEDNWQPNPYAQGTISECRAKALAAEGLMIVVRSFGCGKIVEVHSLIKSDGTCGRCSHSECSDYIEEKHES